MKLTFLAATAVIATSCSCTTLWSDHQPATSHAENQSVAPLASARVQNHWQDRFSDNLKAAGAGAEAWGLFSESSMGDLGQRMVMGKPDGSFSLCSANTGVDQCEQRPLDVKQWHALDEVVGTADGLADRPLQVLDAMHLEYVHLKNNSGNVITMHRVYFMIGDQPLPANYDKLVDGFKSLKSP